jgi:hypothetical protein
MSDFAVLKKIYSCDICKDETPFNQLTGLYFSDLKKFRLAPPLTTDGTQICDGCLEQIREQLAAGVPHIAARTPSEPK